MNTKIILIIEGGVIHEVIANGPVEVLTMDYDIQGGDRECIRNIPQGDGSSEKCYVRFEEVTLDPPKLAKLWKVASASNLTNVYDQSTKTKPTDPGQDS
jgi:hypothetical protein